jgi:HEPN domain-containing protein
MLRESAVEDDPSFSSVCFHAQQCAEKYLKAELLHLKIPFKKVHDLQKLLNDLLPSHPTWKFLTEAAIVLTTLAVEVRYPGTDPLRLDAERSVDYCGMIRQAVRDSFGLEPD